MRETTDAPGLKRRRRKDGSEAVYWVALQASRKAKGYEPKTVSLNHLPAEEWGAKCSALTAELDFWLAEQRTAQPRLQFDGTVQSLLDIYESHPMSPVQGVKYNTRVTYHEAMKIVRQAVGSRLLAKLTGLDFLRWHENFKGDDHVTRAHNAMSIIRRALRWGVVLELRECRRLLDIISEMEFQQSGRREEFMTLEQARAIIDRAIANGRPSIALAQALQFELGLRQKDVIGEWLPAPADAAPAGIMLRNPWASNPQRWDGGLTWSHIGIDTVLRKKVTKTLRSTGAEAVFDLRSYPIVMAEIARVPAEKRVGPMIVSEKTGLPYTANVYRDVWRQIATAAGVPSVIQNRDSRAGAITESLDAGAAMDDVRHHATHRNASMTARYDRSTLQKTKRVAEIRQLLRRKDTT